MHFMDGKWAMSIIVILFLIVVKHAKHFMDGKWSVLDGKWSVMDGKCISVGMGAVG